MKSKDLLKNKTVLIVNTGSDHKRFVFQKLKKLEVNVIALNREKNWADPYVNKWILADTNDYQESLRAVSKFLEMNPDIKIDGVLTFWEESVLLTSKITDIFGLPGIPYKISKGVRNKYLFREFCRNNGIKAPKHKLIKDNENLLKEIKDFTFPLVIKPIYGSSSAFVIKVEDKNELENTISYIKKTISTHPDSSEWDSLELLVEEYIDGDEVDVDVILQNGKIKFCSITDNHDKTLKDVFFFDNAEALPSALPQQDKDDLKKLVEITLEKLGIFNGIIHYEAKATKNGPVPLEVNMRMGGDNVYFQLEKVWDIDFIEYALLIACGIYFEIPKVLNPKKYTIAAIIHPEDSGILTELDIEDELKKEKYFENICMYKELGDPILVPPEGYDLIGWIMVSGDNALDAQDNLKDALEKINYKVTKFDEESYLGKTIRKDKFSAATLNNRVLLKQAKIAKIGSTTKSDLKKLKIGIIGNSFDNPVDPLDILLSDSSYDVSNELIKNGYNARLIEFKDSQSLLNSIKTADIDIIINLARKLDNSISVESTITSILDSTHIPFTGSDSYPITISKDKITFKKLLTYHNIPTPKWDYVFSTDEELDEELEYPLLVKPANKHNSIGISNQSVVLNEKDLKFQINKIITELRSPVLIEEYIAGDEYSVVIMGNEDSNYKVMPLSRIIFDKLPQNLWHIMSYDAKWGKNKDYKNIIFQSPPKKMSKKLETLITEIALDTYSFVRCKDYGQVEIKVDENDNPYVLEINSNPFLNRDNIIARSAKISKISYIGLIEELLLTTIERYKNQMNIIT